MCPLFLFTGLGITSRFSSFLNADVRFIKGLAFLDSMVNMVSGSCSEEKRTWVINIDCRISIFQRGLERVDRRHWFKAFWSSAEDSKEKVLVKRGSIFTFLMILSRCTKACMKQGLIIIVTIALFPLVRRLIPNWQSPNVLAVPVGSYSGRR